MRWEPSYANKATSLLAKNSSSTCAVRWKRRPLVYMEQTGSEARGEAAAFCLEPLERHLEQVCFPETSRVLLLVISVG